MNRTPSRVLNGKTPYEALFHSTTSYDRIRVFGCLCYAYNLQRRKDKFGEQSKRCIFVGYPHGKKGWKVYDIKTGDIFVSRDIIFHEDVYPLATSGSAAHDSFERLEQPMDRMPSTESTPRPSSNEDSAASSGLFQAGLDRSGLPTLDLRQQNNEVRPQHGTNGSPARPSSTVRGSVSVLGPDMEESPSYELLVADVAHQTEEPVCNHDSGPSNRGTEFAKLQVTCKTIFAT